MVVVSREMYQIIDGRIACPFLLFRVVCFSRRCPGRHVDMRRKQQPIHETGLVMLLHCSKCTWLRWFASIPLILILSAGAFMVFVHFAEARDNAAGMILGLFLATWSYVFSVAATILFASWWLLRWHHIRTVHPRSRVAV